MATARGGWAPWQPRAAAGRARRGSPRTGPAELGPASPGPREVEHGGREVASPGGFPFPGGGWGGWAPLSPRCRREQARLRAAVLAQDTEPWQQEPSLAGLRRVGGVDLSYPKGDETRACASLVVLSFPELQVLYEDCRMVAVSTPYVAGFLAFREVPVLVDAVRRLQQEQPALQPQVLLVDGNGLLHPRGFGVACHLGVLTGLPCIGVAKNLLQVDGLVKDELHREQIRSLRREGDTFPLTGSSGRVLGMVLRSSKNSSRPLYISVGHKVCLETAVRVVRSCCRYRIPEPIRQADIRSREYIRKQLCSPLEAASSGPQSSDKEAEAGD